MRDARRYGAQRDKHGGEVVQPACVCIRRQGGERGAGTGSRDASSGANDISRSSGAGLTQVTVGHTGIGKNAARADCS
jgi:hypothetical protein